MGYMYDNYDWDLRPAGIADQVVEVYVNGARIDGDYVYNYYNEDGSWLYAAQCWIGRDFAERGKVRDWPFTSGMHVNLVDEDDDGVIDKIVMTFELLGRVARYDATTGRVRLNVYNIDNLKEGDHTANIEFPVDDAFAADEWVVITPRLWASASSLATRFDFKDGMYNASPTSLNIATTSSLVDIFAEALTIAKADTITNVATARSQGRPGVAPGDTGIFSTADIDGRSYVTSAGIGLGRDEPYSVLNSTEFYLDSHGSIIGHTGTAQKASTLDYVFVRDLQSTAGELAAGTSRSAHAAVTYTDGTSANVRIPLRNVAGDWYLSMYNSNRSVIPAVKGSVYEIAAPGGDKVHGLRGWYSYTLNEDGSINLFRLIAAETLELLNGDQIDVRTGRPAVNTTITSLATLAPGKQDIALSSTELSLVEDGTHKILTGFQNFPINTTTPRAMTVNAPATGPLPPRDLKAALIVYGTDPETRIEKIYMIDGTGSTPLTYGIITRVIGTSSVDGDGNEWQDYEILTNDGEEPIVFKQNVSTYPIVGIGEELEIGAIVQFHVTAGVRHISRVPAKDLVNATTTSLEIGRKTNLADPAYLIDGGPNDGVDIGPPTDLLVLYRGANDGGVLFLDLTVPNLTDNWGPGYSPPRYDEVIVNYFAVLTDVEKDKTAGLNIYDAGSTSRIVAVVITERP